MEPIQENFVDFTVGRFEFCGEKPMILSAAEEQSVDLSPAQRDLMERVMKCLLNYLAASADLLNGKYRNLQSLMPDHLSRPGNVLASIGSDGIAVRFERQSENPFCVRAMWRSSTLQKAVSQLTQNMVRCVREGDATEDVEDEGVTITINATTSNAGNTREVDSMRVVTTITLATSQPQSISPAKPHCAISLLSAMQFRLDLVPIEETHRSPPAVVIGNQQPPVGWECLQIFASCDHDAWIPGNARQWAELDILALYLTVTQQQEMYRSLDPRSEARRLFRDKLQRFRTLLAEAQREEDLQVFLTQNPYLLCPHYSRLWPKLPFGATVSDYVFELATDYLLVEIEPQNHKLFTKSGDPTAKLTHAISQTDDWTRYIQDNLTTVRNELQLDRITPHPKRLVVIGRDRDLTEDNKRRLRVMERDNLKIWTYDDVYSNAKTTIENFFGPLDEPAPDTQIYFPMH